MSSPVRVCLDVDVLLAIVVAWAKEVATDPVRLVEACRRGPVRLVVSRDMLEQLIAAITRWNEQAFDAAVDWADLLQQMAVVGGGSIVEGADALAAARVGKADYLVTYRVQAYANRSRIGKRGSNPRAGSTWIVTPEQAVAELGLS